MKKINKYINRYNVYSDIPIPKKKADYVYVIQIGEVSGGRRLVKIGTTNDIYRRMLQHRNHYEQDIYILWVSNPIKKGTSMQVELDTREKWKARDGFDYIPQDRFWVPASLTSLSVKVRNTYEVPLV